jgi:hypothetical protein
MGIKRTRCQICGKDKIGSIFKSIKRRKVPPLYIIQRYCPLVDPPEMYDATLKQRTELDAVRYRRKNAKRLKLK